MRFISIVCHEGIQGNGAAVYGPYLEGSAHDILCKRALEKANKLFNNGYKLIAQVQYEYDPEKETFDVTILEKKTAPPPKTIEINLAAKPKEGVKKVVKKKIPELMFPGAEIAW